MTGVMNAFPPAPEGQATLANWRTAPFNKWAFHHVREVVPSAEIANDPDDTARLEAAARDLSGLSFTAPSGESMGFDAFLETTDTDGLVILKDGRIIHESYANGMHAGTPHILMSVSKSMLGLLAGILVDKGLLDPEQPASDIVPEVTDTAYRGASVRHRLDMRAGIAFDEDYLATSGPIIQYRKATNWNPLESGEAESDLRSFYANLTEADGDHGRGFHYVSPNTDLLGWIIERAGGKPYAELMSEFLWRPMGANRPGYVTVDRLGAPRAAGGMCVTTRDLALVGQLLINDGKRDGAQIIPSGWITDIATAGDPAAWQAGEFAPKFSGMDIHYRTKWYVHRSEGGARDGAMLFGVGVHGQNLFVDAARGLVIAKFSSQALPLDEDRIKLTTAWVQALRTQL